MQRLVLTVVALLGVEGCIPLSPTAPDPFPTGADTASPHGDEVTIVEVAPPPSTVIETAIFPRVLVRYELKTSLRDPRVWACLATKPAAFIISSCRDARAGSPSGEVSLSPNIYRVNNVRATSETRYIVTFLVDGDIVAKRRLYDHFEIGFGRLSRDVLAAHRLEHPWSWR